MRENLPCREISVSLPRPTGAPSVEVMLPDTGRRNDYIHNNYGYNHSLSTQDPGMREVVAKGSLKPLVHPARSIYYNSRRNTTNGRMPKNASRTRIRSAVPRGGRSPGDRAGPGPRPRGLPRGKRRRPDRRRGLPRAAPQTGSGHPRSHRPPDRTPLLHRRGVRRDGPERQPLIRRALAEGIRV